MPNNYWRKSYGFLRVFTTRAVIPYIQACLNEYLTIKLAFKHCFINKYTHSSGMYGWQRIRFKCHLGMQTPFKTCACNKNSKNLPAYHLSSFPVGIFSSIYAKWRKPSHFVQKKTQKIHNLMKLLIFQFCIQEIKRAVTVLHLLIQDKTYCILN